MSENRLRFSRRTRSACAFEALTGRHPFERASTRDTLAAIRGGFVPELAEWLPAEAEPCAELFASALAAERAQRPGTAAEFADLLRKAADAASERVAAA